LEAVADVENRHMYLFLSELGEWFLFGVRCASNGSDGQHVDWVGEGIRTTATGGKEAHDFSIRD
jgi:hypothetical protein